MASAADGGLNVPEGALPPQFADLKREIAAATPGFETKLPAAWADLIAELATRTDQIAQAGSDYVPQVEFSELEILSPQQVDTIKRRGCVLIRNVVDDSEAIKWREELQEYVKSNPDAEGFPENDKQFLQLYWTRPQVQARSHGNVLKASTFLNKLYDPTPTSADIGVDTSTPLSYADRFRLRKPGVQWDAHPPHVDGGSIERWQADSLRACFSDILTGDWRNHNPYLLEPRVKGRSSLYGRPNQSSVFRTYQGWLSLSDTAPGEGTLQVFPDVLLSNAYTIMRPFFKLKSRDADPMSADNWELDLESSAFPGILPRDGGFMGPRPTPQAHPHLALEKTMTSVPQVRPGDMVFWHCDLVHAVEREHAGENSSCVMYIPAVPHTPQNAAYVTRQRESFLKGDAPPDFPRHKGEGQFKGCGKEMDLGSEMGRHAMGFSAVA